jgi:flagellar protein FliJ
MSQAAIESLQPLLEQAEAERDAALAALRAAEQAAARSQAQADQLQQYRVEFRARWDAHFARQGTVALLQCRHGFAQRLDQAIDQQGRQCLAGERQLAQARARLKQREMRLAAVRKLLERRLETLRLAGARREQKQTDEAAQRVAWAARPTDHGH